MGLTPGTRLTSRYTLAARIGRGGMSEVWRGHDEVLGRQVAVKALAPQLTADPALRAAIWREARAAARLTHPHVTQIYDYGEAKLGTGQSIAYLVMELVDGHSLADRLVAGPLNWVGAARMSAQIAAALAAAHRLGVVHRDVKPGNIMLTAAGAKVLDFGIAALHGTPPDQDGGLLFGTPAYAAPERLEGSAAHPAGDVYSLGAVLYETLPGRPPFPVASWAEAAAAHARRARPAAIPASGAPADLSMLCLACLSPDPVQRPTAHDVAALLSRLLAGADPVPAPGMAAGVAPSRPPTLVDRLPPPPQPVTRAPATTGTIRGSGRRITGSAPVVHRPRPPVVDPEPDAHGRPRSPVAAVGVAGAVVAAALALTLLVPALKGDAGAGTAVPGATATAGDGAGAVPAVQQTSTPSSARQWAEAVLSEIDRLLGDAVAAGRIRPDVARDLREDLDALRKRLADGKLRDFRERADKLLDKVRDRLDAGAIGAQAAEDLPAAVEPYLRFGAPGGDG